MSSLDLPPDSSDPDELEGYIEPNGFAILKQHELKSLSRRREQAGFTASDGAEGAEGAISRELVGLALSGGGIRSASFNLGVLQALDHYGLFRYVDYLATVSGGGYIGARFSSAFQALPGSVGGVDRPPLSGTGRCPIDADGLLLRAGPEGRQEPETKRLLGAGHYLGHLLLLANRYFIGLAKINLALGSLVLALCALLAMIWRYLDETPACEIILMLTGGTIFEAVRPFFFTFVFLLAWAVGWGLSATGSHRRGRSLVLGLLGEAALLLVTLGWQWLELRGFGLHPESHLWKLARPLPFLLAIAWPLACIITFPGPGPRGTDGDAAGRGRLPGRKSVVFGIAAAAAVTALVWRGLEAFEWVDLWAERPWWLLLRPLPFLAAIGLPVAWWLATRQSEAPALDVSARLQWLLLLAAVSFLIGCAVFLATPSISLVPPTKMTAANQGRTSFPQTLLPTLAGILLAALLPFLSPRRLLESGLRPKKFWQPWIFYIACTAAVIGVPLMGIWFFARHDVSGRNADREHKLLPYDVEWDRFWRRAKRESAEDRGQGTRLRPAAWIWNGLSKPEQDQIEDYLRTKTWGQANPLRPFHFGSSQYRTVRSINAQVFGAEPSQLQRETTLQREITALGGDPGGRDLRQSRQWPAIERLLKLKDQLELKPEEVKVLDRKINRLLLEARYPEEISSQELIRRSPLTLDDQFTRFILGIAFFLIALASARLIRINGTSLHQFYRDQLASVYIWPGTGAGQALPLSRLRSVPDKGGPLHLICATFNAINFYDLLWRLTRIVEESQRQQDADPDHPARPSPAPHASTDEKRSFQDELLRIPIPASPAAGMGKDARGGRGLERETPTDKDTFVLSPLYCGCDPIGYRRTDLYHHAGRELSLSEAVALSGAAVSPSQFDNPLSLFLAVLNMRLGQWLPSPRSDPPPPPGEAGTRPRGGRFPGSDQPSILELLGDRAPDVKSRSYFFISDGGHHENLGLGVLLQRRCRLIFVSDATADRLYSFDDFLRLCRRERIDNGIRFVDATPARGEVPGEVRLDAIRPRVRRWDYSAEAIPDRKNLDWLSEQHYFLARIRYPSPAFPFDMEMGEKERLADMEGPSGGDEPPEGYLVYLKPSLTGDEDNDLKKHWAEHPEFPHDPTANQFYDRDTVESYRQLGYHIGQELCRDLGLRGDGEGHEDPDFRRIFSLVKNLIGQRRSEAEVEATSQVAASPGRGGAGSAGSRAG